jgi:hypothetical protein
VLLLGRPVTQPGAHVRGHNAETLGVCVVGDFDLNPPSPFLKADVFDALGMLAFVFGLEPDDVCFHRDLDPRKTCPGRLWNLDEVRAGVARRLRGDWPEIGRHLRLDLINLP